MKKINITKEDIIKIVSNSQKIEGYKLASKSLSKKAKVLMMKYNIHVSL